MSCGVWRRQASSSSSSRAVSKPTGPSFFLAIRKQVSFFVCGVLGSRTGKQKNYSSRTLDGVVGKRLLVICFLLNQNTYRQIQSLKQKLLPHLSSLFRPEAARSSPSPAHVSEPDPFFSHSLACHHHPAPKTPHTGPSPPGISCAPVSQARLVLGASRTYHAYVVAVEQDLGQLGLAARVVTATPPG